MCILFALIEATGSFESVVVHLRDEDPDRPTLPPQLGQPAYAAMPERNEAGRSSNEPEPSESTVFPPNIVAGLDVQAGGTWMGFNRATGTLVALTNVRNKHFPPPPADVRASRGDIVRRLLDVPLLEYVRSAGIDPAAHPDWATADPRVELDLGAAYSGFNILLLDAYNPDSGAFTLSNCSRSRLQPFDGQRALLCKVGGKHVAFSNGVLGDSWLKVEWLASHLAPAIRALPREASIDDLLAAVEPLLLTETKFTPAELDAAEGDVADSPWASSQEYFLRGNVFAAPGRILDQNTVTRALSIVVTTQHTVSYAYTSTHPLPDPRPERLEWTVAQYPRHRHVSGRPQLAIGPSLADATVAAFGACFVTLLGAQLPSADAEQVASLIEGVATCTVPVELVHDVDTGRTTIVREGGAGEAEALGPLPLGHYSQPLFSHGHTADACLLDTVGFVLDVAPVALCAAVLVFDAAGAVLATRRHTGPIFPLKWVFPGGRVDAGESLPCAAVRELYEETGLQIAPEMLTPIGVWESHLATIERAYAIVYFAATLPDSPPIESLTFPAAEVSLAAWIPATWHETIIADDDTLAPGASQAARALETVGLVIGADGSRAAQVSCEQLRVLRHGDSGILEELAVGHKFALALVMAQRAR
ncbi:nucleoside diphosphate-linked moiety X domain-containing protein 17 [Thecamonas trahens ATCC 50062]|uniref:Nucleoside diphosphate-linked moiety X domain-containing protein 17 n=1 Tax=Thecamonas trahens ATCC 50062 TaxID=461836 RepID=A0A0L0D1Q8_THETB|nr:nucleoside diphosphate-linked moiety X domain-containing protein 17 [Thecamonas trahens ATCC 50062]KNC46192.1 nucleoside diphosphate-linked moiety X domain-containing protein 17 [Thecamonas trahens ATCC 50062]|eukprot:XP_013763167.1 nucleoside diphosphate-linked moiety X domain-containing protein 17 [Thecamonas trahens ATCC 50062]